MKAEAEKLYNYTGNNPFSDVQGRNYSDPGISAEFIPTSIFWTLFNNHHEILLGTRGCGKTFLLKMMRRSMVAKINHDLARKIINENIYHPLYVPMHMETVSALNDKRINDERKIILFKCIFNALLAESMIDELIDYLERNYEKKEQMEINARIALKILQTWFPDIDKGEVADLQDLAIMVRQYSSNFDYITGKLESIPVAFKRDFAGTLISIQPILEKYMGIGDESVWLICIDEAEFVPVLFQRCINSFMRSNTNRIVLKVATLPFYWETLSTLDENILISAENDFNYRLLDMDSDSEDYIVLTNRICSHRLKNINMNVDSLEDFLGTVGNDNRIDYYRSIVGDDKAKSEQVIEDIRNAFSERRRMGSASYPQKEKTIHQKFAPILYVREVYKMPHAKGKGRLVPGWYAGADIVRKVSQGNPRLFIRLMSSLFSKATSNKFSTKLQHQVIYKFAEEFCNASLAIEVDGHLVYHNLSETGKYIQYKVHQRELISVGNTFLYRYKNEADFLKWKRWIQRAIAFSRICVSNDAVVSGLSQNTVYTFSNAYSVKYWIPMRSDVPTKVSTEIIDVGAVNYLKKGEDDRQMSMFNEGDD